MDGMSFTRRVSLSWTSLNETMRAEVQMGPSKEELKVELPSKEEEEDEEDLFISKRMEKDRSGSYL